MDFLWFQDSGGYLWFFIVLAGFIGLFMVLVGFYMVLDGFFFFMVPGQSFVVPVGFHGPGTVVHNSKLVFMVLHTSRLIYIRAERQRRKARHTKRQDIPQKVSA